MITVHQQFDFYGKKTFEKATIRPPFRFVFQMPNEACFFYLTQGKSQIVTPTEQVRLIAQEGVVMQCGNYISEMLSASPEVPLVEAVAVHLYPEVLKMIYNKEFPNFLLELENTKPIVCEKHKASALLKNYIDSLQFYFDNPTIVSDELLALKIKELILLLAKTDNADTIKSLILGLFSPTTIDFKTIIEQNLFIRLSLDELAALTNLSLSSFKRTFAKHYHSTPAKYIKQSS